MKINSQFLCLFSILISALCLPFQCKWTYREGKGISLNSSISLMENHLNIVSSLLFMTLFQCSEIGWPFFMPGTPKNVQAFDKAYWVNEK